MDRKREAELLGDDVAEYVSRYSEKEPLLERIRETRRSQHGHGGSRLDGRMDEGEMIRLAPGTRARVQRLKPARRNRMVNAALGAAIFATVSGAALVILESPYSYIFAAGSAALAVITLAREARNHA